MTESTGERSLVRYFCTAGSGIERFLIDEVKKKLEAEDVCQIPGKVLFSSSVDINQVRQLKAAERLFLLLKQDSPVCLSAHTNSAMAASVLQSRLLGDGNQWTSAVMTWSRLQGELADRRTTINTPCATVGVVKKRGEEERRSEEQEECNVQSQICTGRQTEASGSQRSGKQNGAQSQARKRKRNEEEEEGEERGSAVQISASEMNVEKEMTRIEEGEEEKGIITKFHSSPKNGKHGVTSRTHLTDKHQATPGRERDEESNVKRMDGMVKEGVGKVKSAGGKDKNLLQPSRINPDSPSVPVSFRISCKCTGSLSRYFSSQEASKVIGVGVSRLLGWKTDLRNPQLEVNVYLSDDHCLLGIPLTRLPLATRCYMKTTGLRSTVAWAMASLVQIQPGFCVVDPMCGVGTILIEAAQEHKAACFLGVDIDDGQLQKANENIKFAELGNRIHLLKASSMELPLPSASVDAVICDLPFGRKFGTKANVAANLPLILTEMERVLCIGGTMVLLLSPTLSSLLKNLMAQKDTAASNQEAKSQTGTSSSLSFTRQQTAQIHQGTNSPPTQKIEHQSGLRHSLPPVLSSLKHEATLRVSLGLIDGLIHKYVKMDAC